MSPDDREEVEEWFRLAEARRNWLCGWAVGMLSGAALGFVLGALFAGRLGL
jgi:hypothetical protein